MAIHSTTPQDAAQPAAAHASPVADPAPSQSEPLSPLVAKLSELRARYLAELQAARDKVKQNFLK